MDDLAGLDWNMSSPKPNPVSAGTGNYYPTLRPTPPISGRSTPALNSAQPAAPSNSNGPSKSGTPAHDSFAHLLPFNSAQSAKNLSLQEHQKRLQEDRSKQELDRRKELGISAHRYEGGAWDTLGNGSSTPSRVISPPSYAATDEYGGQKLSSAINKPFTAITDASGTKRYASESNDDLLAAFDASAPVDNSSYFPTSSDIRSSSRTPSGLQSVRTSALDELADDDDDPFGLGTGPAIKSRPPDVSTYENDEDDVLGLLGKSVSELPPRNARSPTSPAAPYSTSGHPVDRAIAELVDMGFSPDKSREALETTESGMDVQGAIGWLLNQAHQQSNNKSGPTSSRGRRSNQDTEATHEAKRNPATDSGAALPAWMRQQSRSTSAQHREDSRSPANGDRDPTNIAAELGNNLFKTAGSLWKTGTKKLNQAVAEFNLEVETTQPKWMQAEKVRTPTETRRPKPRSKPELSKAESKLTATTVSPQVKSPSMTDEAMMLESGNSRPRPRQRPQPLVERPVSNMNTSRDLSPVILAGLTTPQPPSARLPRQLAVVQPRLNSSRHFIEGENATAYVSPGRRKKAAPKPSSPEIDLLVNASRRAPAPIPSQSNVAPKAARVVPTTSTPLSVRQPVPKRNIPQLSSIAFQSSTFHRLQGTASFKIGNYGEATSSYTASLSFIPPTHPLTIPLLTNRALTHLKTGDPKATLSDASAALSLIGPSRGNDESIDMGPPEGLRPMFPFWGKAMTRRAEALEQLERWTDAANAWKECVEAGIGGSTSIQARNRCEKAAGGDFTSQASVPRKKVTPQRSAPKSSTRSALDDLSGYPLGNTSDHASSAEAVTRLRAANKEAERVDDEKFALADSVDDRLTRWRKGKEGNLRALLGSLDTVLWEESGWKKIAMSDLILPGKVKMNYMKGISKVHPDKLPTDATTEQVMISGAVFSLLNEAWERFKSENGL